MKIEEFYVLNSLYNGSKGRAGCKAELERKKALSNQKTVNALLKAGFISSENNLTESGLKALEPYKVNNAIILAAGASTRFIPLSLEQPKG